MYNQTNEKSHPLLTSAEKKPFESCTYLLRKTQLRKQCIKNIHIRGDFFSTFCQSDIFFTTSQCNLFISLYIGIKYFRAQFKF